MKGKKMIWISLGIVFAVVALLFIVAVLQGHLNFNEVLSTFGNISPNDGGDKVPDRVFVGLIKSLL